MKAERRAALRQRFQFEGPPTLHHTHENVIILELLDALDKAEGDSGQLAISALKMGAEIARLRELAERMHWDVGWCYLNLEALRLPPGTRNEYFTERMTRAAELLNLFVFDEKAKTCALKEDWRLP